MSIVLDGRGINSDLSFVRLHTSLSNTLSKAGCGRLQTYQKSLEKIREEVWVGACNLSCVGNSVGLIWKRQVNRGHNGDRITA